MATLEIRNIEERRESLRRWIPEAKNPSLAQGIHHLAVFAKDLESTAEFYSQTLGMPVVNVTANRDVIESTHMTVDIGNDITLAFFDFPHVPRLARRAPEGSGNVMHVAIAVSNQRVAVIKKRLDAQRWKYQEIDSSIYMKDPNGLGIEILAID